MNILNLARKGILVAAIGLTAGLMFVNVYNSLVDVPNWGASIEATRAYYKAAHPGTFFRMFAPLAQLLLLVALALNWKAGPKVRLATAAAFLIAVAADAFTFSFFYPRNDIMFVKPIENMELVKQAWGEWAAMNWLRSTIIGVSMGFSFKALMELAALPVPAHAKAPSAQVIAATA